MPVTGSVYSAIVAAPSSGQHDGHVCSQVYLHQGDEVLHSVHLSVYNLKQPWK